MPSLAAADAVHLPNTGLDFEPANLASGWAVTTIDGQLGPADRLDATHSEGGNTLTAVFEWVPAMCAADYGEDWMPDDWLGTYDGSRWITCYPLGNGHWLHVTMTGFPAWDFEDRTAFLASAILDELVEAVDALEAAGFVPPSPRAPVPPLVTEPPEVAAVTPDPTVPQDSPTPTPTGRRRAPLPGTFEVGGRLMDLDLAGLTTGDVNGAAVAAEWAHLHPTDPIAIVTRVRGAVGAYEESGLAFDLQVLGGGVLGSGAIRAEVALGLGADAIGTKDPDPVVFRMPPKAMWIVAGAIELGRPTSEYGARFEYSYHRRGGELVDVEGRIRLAARLLGGLTVGLGWTQYNVGDVEVGAAFELSAGWRL